MPRLRPFNDSHLELAVGSLDDKMRMRGPKTPNRKVSCFRESPQRFPASREPGALVRVAHQMPRAVYKIHLLMIRSGGMFMHQLIVVRGRSTTIPCRTKRETDA